MASALVPGGLVLAELPPERLPDTGETRELPDVRVGEDVYSATVRSEPVPEPAAEPGVIRTTFTYRVERQGDLLREQSEGFTMWPAPREEIAEELREAGLSPLTADAPAPGLIAGRR